MKLNIPYVKQKFGYDCGIASIKMVLGYFKNNITYTKLLNMVSLKNQDVWTIELAIILKKLGFSAKYYTNNLNQPTNHKIKNYKFYRKHVLKLIEESKNLNIPLIEKSLTLEQILKKFNKNNLIIIALNWTIVDKNLEGLNPHFVPVIGYDKDYVFVHNSGAGNPQKNLKIPKNTFESARLSNVDEDIIFISKP